MDSNLEALISRVAMERDKGAFKELFRRLAPRLKGYFFKNGVKSGDADDLVQDVMLKVWARASHFDHTRASLNTWVFTIARNTLIDRIRRERRPEPDPNDPLFQKDEPSLESVVDDRRLGHLLSQELDALPPEQAEVVRRSYYQGDSLATIAEATNAPLGTVKTRARLALKRLREQFVKGGLP